MIFLACGLLSIVVYVSMRRVGRMNEMKSQTEAENAALLVESAKASANAERELNDFIAHEVRNPLAAAISALSFVSMEVNADPPLASTESRQSVKEDVSIIKDSLMFINDLLRSMLDMHRAASHQMTIVMAPTDIMKDVFEPVSSMLYRRGENYKVILECPDNLLVSTDRLRLAQIVLNLGRNAAKFVTIGFIRLRAEVVDGEVQLSVEDSGPGIPEDKRRILFSKFQESLDSLNQGTGIGLCLCKHLVGLMNGDLWLDETFNSGVANCPGTRFVVDLNAPPLHLDSGSLDKYAASPQYELLQRKAGPSCAGPKFTPPIDETKDEPEALPKELSVLFVDDDVVLRKLFSRAIKRVEPGCHIQEAGSGEAALDLVNSHKFDLIFMDQYMASLEKQLLGTETVALLRAKGLTSRICGLSANDMETAFLNAGADFFILKPIQSSKDALTRELGRLLFGERVWKPKAFVPDTSSNAPTIPDMDTSSDVATLSETPAYCDK
jgi:signal transduction histidine kinase/CheY-like chemotaxis protein